MSPGAMTCLSCGFPLPTEFLNRAEMVACPGCRRPMRVDVYPAYVRPFAPAPAGERALMDGEAGCFYHPQRRAAVPCDACGRFLCALCDCELHGQHLCPTCLQTGRDQGRLRSLEQSRVRYDNVALALAILPLLVFYFTIITAPMTVYLVIRHWNTTLSVIPRSRVRFVLAFLIALLQLAGWAVLAYVVVRGLRE
jgi:hypothetical protein